MEVNEMGSQIRHNAIIRISGESPTCIPRDGYSPRMISCWTGKPGWDGLGELDMLIAYG